MKHQQKIIIENYIKSYNSFDITGMIKDLAEDIGFENISDGKVNLRTEGINEFKKQAESAKQYFQQRNQIIKSWEFKDSTVTIIIDYHGILATDLPNGLKKGDSLRLQGTSEFEFKNSKIIGIKDES